ncbi:MAG: OPT/YSL family transporter [Streptococcaceae bacterium]|nr:OPT/YSL family transporter [Streptococcaceae bacterium]
MSKHLSKTAYGGVKGKDYVPYEDGRNVKAGQPIVLVIGIILAVLFAASTAYSGMKSGLTVAAGIPGAILGSGLLSIFVRKNSFLKKNILQAMSSGGEAIASGIIFVLPSIILIGGHVNFLQGILVGIAAVLFSVGTLAFVQDYLLIEEHGKLKYPESMAISETLVASDTGGDAMKFMGIGFGIGALINATTSYFFGFFNNTISYVNETFYKWKFEMEVNPLLSAIGFIVGLEISVMMFAGSLLSNFAVAPLIGFFSEKAGDATVWNNTAMTVKNMDFAAISGSYVKYIGAGMMISGGLIGAIRLIPTIITSVKRTLEGRKKQDSAGSDALGFIAIGLGTILTFIAGFMITNNVLMALLGSAISLLLSILFIIVSGRLTGTIGTSNLPVSGMTIASLVILTLVFLVMGWTSDTDKQTLLMFGTFIVIAISVAGGYTQSQKVTFITGGNMNEVRRYNMLAAIIGVVVVVGMIILLKNQLLDANQFALPQANLMETLTRGILDGNLPWNMIIVGIVIGIAFYLLKLPVMTIAIGFYLPISTTTIILVGALIRVFVEKVSAHKGEGIVNARISSGVSLSSGLVAGASIIGLVGIIFQSSGMINPDKFMSLDPTKFVGGNTIAWIILAVLTLATIIPIMSVNKPAHVDFESNED